MSIVIKPNTEKFVSEFVGKHINSPEQRLIQGATALAMQPLIDFNNKAADDDTRAVSVARTIGKIIAGTIVGVGVRYASIYAAKQFSRYTLKEGPKYLTQINRKSKRDILLPKFNCEKTPIKKQDFLDKYDKSVKTLGTIIATFAMIFTNFLIDAPLTRKITKKLTSRVKAKIEDDKMPLEVKDAKG